MMCYPVLNCRMLNTEGGKTVHNAMEECTQKGATELKLDGSFNKEES